MTDTRRAGLAFALGCLFFAYAFALRVSPSVMVEELMRDFNAGAAILGNLSAFYFYAYAGLQIPVGLLLDRIGPRRLIIPAAGIVSIGCWLFASSDWLILGYAGRLAIGAGCAFSWAATLALVNQWFPSRFALFAGVSQLVAMVGAVAAQAPLAMVVQEIGWRSSMTAFAVFGLILTTALFVVVRDKKIDEGFRRDSEKIKVLKNTQTWLVAFFTLTMTAPLLALGGLWSVPFLTTTYAMERTTAAAVTSMLFLGNGLGCVILGWWSDRIQRRKPPMIIGAVTTTVFQVLFIYLTELSVVTLGFLSLGIGLGSAALVVGFACGREHNTSSNVGLTIGIINTATTGSGAVFQPAVGWLLDMRWRGKMIDGTRLYEPETFQLALTILPVTSFVGLLFVLLIKETYARVQQK
ncbi:MAG: MFS transporter [Rhodospirillaceae bacterium]|nr:MFS transporter [Rhodospirillaceae bacterium]